MKDFWKQFYDENPYQDFPMDSYEIDTQGWNSAPPIGLALIEALKPKIMIEVGVWKGASTLFWACQMRRLKIEGNIIAIDTFLASPEHWMLKGDKKLSKIKYGRPQLYNIFMGNVIHFKYTDIIVPLAQTSSNAAKILQYMNMSAQLIYIDGSHEYRDVLNDLHDYFDLLEPGGSMIGDDFSHPDVGRALKDFCRDRSVELLSFPYGTNAPNDTHWAIEKEE